MEEKKVKIDEVSISDTDNNDTTKVKSEDVANVNEEEFTDASNDSEVEQLNKKISELNDKYLRTAAELENMRRRAALDSESNARNRAMSVAKKFLPVMDAVEAALKLNPEDEGIKSMALAMENAFTQVGITKIDSVGQILNPQYHNAIQVVDASDGCEKKAEPNTIVEELQSGYMFGDAVLRTAMVVVCK